MGRLSRTTPIQCDFFLWKPFQRRGVWYVDGRGNKPNPGKRSLGTRSWEQAQQNLKRLDRHMAVELGLAKPEVAVDGDGPAVSYRALDQETERPVLVRVLSGAPELGEALAANYRVAEITPRSGAMLDFAVRITRASAQIEERDRQALRDHGFADADIWDIAAVAGFFAMSNRVASAVAMRPNPDYHAQGR